MPATEWGWLITPEELRSWVLEERPDLLILNKPAHVVCHPSKHGPWSSLIGACREWLGVDRLHMPFRLDRETTGVVLMVKDAAVASRMQKAVEQRSARKEYVAILRGELRSAEIVDAPIGREGHPLFATRQWVREDGSAARTEFFPEERRGGYTLVRVVPHTGRLHQIRVHAAWMGHPLLGDKLYPDPEWMTRFITEGFTEAHAAALRFHRHALHCETAAIEQDRFHAPVAGDMLEFWRGLQ